MTAVRHVAIFASGAGSNARNLIQYFSNHPAIKCSLLVCNKTGAGAFAIAEEYGLPSRLITRDDFQHPTEFLRMLEEYHITDIVLAGFLWKVPASVIQAFPQHIYNIHPSLLPKYGGKGMYGHAVHEAVFHAHEQESGITIHLVNEHYDEGAVIAQIRTDVSDAKSPMEIETRVRALEMAHFPSVIESVLMSDPGNDHA